MLSGTTANPFEEQYLNLLRDLVTHGVQKGDRTGTGMRELFAPPQMEFDLNSGLFPLLTTKKMFTKGVIVELLWFLRGDTNIQYLNDHGVNIWNEWADENGDLGPVYGAQWRRWPDLRATHQCDDYYTVEERGIDQVANLLEEIRTNPNSRRMMVVAWNPAALEAQKLPACHCLWQTCVQPLSEERRKRYAWATNPDVSSEAGEEELNALGIPTSELHLKLYQRSADWFLGVPFNIASYAMLLRMLAQVTGLAPGRFIHTFGSAHLYNNHWDQALTQLERTPLAAPKMRLNPDVKELDDFKLEDFTLEDYESHPKISAPISV